jgi:FkbH-like protein
VYQDLDWLPERTDWGRLTEVRDYPPREALAHFRVFANSRMDFARAWRLDKTFQRYRSENDLSSLVPGVRLALIGSSTLSHLHAGIRLGGLRRGILVDVYEGIYGMYRQELMDPNSGLHRFAPDAILLSLDSRHLTAPEGCSVESVFNLLRSCWTRAQQAISCAVIQQTVLPVLPYLLGNQEYLLGNQESSGSPAAIIAKVNAQLREEAPKDNIHLLTVDTWAAQSGVFEWFDPALWYRSKQEIHPRASCVYGDHVGRILAALRGKSFKCLVLDLDNTLWGGVVGDDGVDGIVIGQGSENGEAFLELQGYAKRLAERGVILAVCYKNDETHAIRPFRERSEMILKETDIACFIANWEDKAANLRRIAERLNIGLDSLVFVDDNPAERDLVRRELPMVAVPELPEDPAGYVQFLSAAGYFETLSITEEDRDRNRQYSANRSREELRESATDLEGFLRALRMKMLWSSFNLKDIKRIVQLVNKTNQFNLTTRRYTEEEVRKLMTQEDVLTLQVRLLDVYGNNGIIAMVIGKRNGEAGLEMDTWLMSCRVLGRHLEQATLNIIAQEARVMGCSHLTGIYRPTASNEMVRNHYQGLGFSRQETAADGSVRWFCPLDQLVPFAVQIEIIEEDGNGVARDLYAAD